MFAIVDEKDRYHGTYKTEVEATKKARKLAEEYKGIEFHVYRNIWMCCNPTDEQKAEKDFWS